MVKVKTPPKDVTIRSTLGHTVHLPASSEETIPDSLIHEALARGCAIADEDFEVVEQEKPSYGKEAMERKTFNEIEAIIKEMMKDKKPHEWTREGRPSAKTVSRLRKAKTTAIQVDKVWNERFGDS